MSELHWLRTAFPAPRNLVDGSICYYIDGVRSDGYQFRAGVEAKGTIDPVEIEERLRSALDYYLGETHVRGIPVPMEAHKAEEGWTER